jgi:Kef-type K+ transport system membrane component KefB
MVSVLPGAIVLGLMFWVGTNIVRSVLKKEPVKDRHCAVLAGGLVIVDFAISLVISVMAWLSHSETEKDRVPIYWLVLFLLLVVFPALGLLRLRKRSTGTKQKLG